MAERNIKKKVMTVMGTIILLFDFNSVASATPLNPHGYAEQTLTLTNYGGYFASAYASSNLNSNWSSTNNSRFITNELWQRFTDANEWIEVGDVDGVLNSAYWNGHYTAYQKYNSSTFQYEYHEYTVGTKSPTGTHNFEIQYTGNSSPWSSYVDYNKAYDFTLTNTSSPSIDVGIETNDSAATFTNNIYDTGMQRKDSVNSWHNWTSTNVINNDYNSLGWTSLFNTTTDRITFSHP